MSEHDYSDEYGIVPVPSPEQSDAQLARAESATMRTIRALDEYIAQCELPMRTLIHAACRRSTAAGLAAVSAARQLNDRLISVDEGEQGRQDALRLLSATPAPKDQTDGVAISVVAWAVRLIDITAEGGETKPIPMLSFLTASGVVANTFGWRCVDDLATMSVWAERPSRAHPWRIVLRQKQLDGMRRLNTVVWEGYADAEEQTMLLPDQQKTRKGNGKT